MDSSDIHYKMTSMTESISAAEANRQFSRLLRGVREEGATYIVTAHGRPVARIGPVDAADEVRASARDELLDELRKRAATGARNWTREEMYEDGV